MRLPLFWKLLVVTLLPLVAFAVLGFTMNRLAHRAHGVARQAHYLAQKESEAELGRRLVAVSQATAALLRAEDAALLQPGDEELRTYRRLRAQLQQVARRTGARRIYLVDRKRRSLCDTQGNVRIGAEYYHLDVQRDLLARVFRKGTGASRLFTGKDGAPYKTGFSPLTDDKGRVIAALAVEGSAATFAHLRRLDAQLKSLRKGLFSPLLIALFVGIGLLVLVGASLLLARSVTRPVRHLVSTAAAIGRGELEMPVEAESRDEIGDLARSMNRMRRDLLARQQEMQLMLSGIAHEVRNPLGGMELFAGLLREEVADEPERKDMVARIQRELDYLERVVSEFLDYARESELERRRFDWVEQGRELIELCAADADARAVSLELDATGEVPVQGDREKLRRALLNVLRNAIQASPEGGTVTLTVTQRDTEVVLRCRDHGPGIPAEDLDKIFNAFYTTRERGTGLGLALTQKIVAAHDGRIEVDSSPEEGTEFRFVLPRPTRDPGERG